MLFTQLAVSLLANQYGICLIQNILQSLLCTECLNAPLRTIDLLCFKGRDGHFWRKKDSFYKILKMKIVSAWIQTPNPWVAGVLITTELFDLLMTGHTIISSTNIFVYISVINHDFRLSFFKINKAFYINK